MVSKTIYIGQQNHIYCFYLTYIKKPAVREVEGAGGGVGGLARSADGHAGGVLSVGGGMVDDGEGGRAAHLERDGAVLAGADP